MSSVLDAIVDWQRNQFTGTTLDGLIKHAELELQEIKKAPEDQEEWVDLLFIALHGLSLLTKNYTLELQLKLEKNMNRKWNSVEPGKATTHVE
jgi:Protein of unknown function (DUF550)